jgi:hypothetical protein
MTTASPTTPRSRPPREGVRLGLAASAPPELEELVRSLLASDEVLDRLEPLGTPGLHTRLAKFVVETGSGPRRYAVKRYAWPFLAALRTWGHGTRARSEFSALEALEPLVPVPVRAAAWGERRALGFALRSVLVTELLEDAIDLKAWRLSFARGDRSRGERERLVQSLPELARLLRRIHDAGFFAANAFQKNVLWRPDAPAAESFSLVDLPFARCTGRPLSRRRRVYDLACLDKDASMVLSSSERLRFFLAYEGRPLEAGDRGVLARVASERVRRAHATFFSRIERSVKKSLKRTSLGKLLTGRDPEERRFSTRAT